MNKLQIYKSEQFGTIRMDVDENGKPLFCASDITKALGYANSSKAIAMHCKEKGITKRYTLTNGGKQALTYIDEGNMYRLITHSKLPDAEAFETWVFDEVLPEIRRTGGYNSQQSNEFKAKRLEIMMINAKARLMKEQNKRIELMIKNPEYTPTEDLPPVVPKTYTATEVANKIGRLSNANGLKDKVYGEWYKEPLANGKEVESFRYNENGVNKLRELLKD